ncbi:aminodeoxychorismate lyase [Fibrobacteria bacterium R8-3-H12]
MASVVEEEAAVPQEQVQIAGVFLNRLRIGMPLGADPTVRFIFRNLTGPIYKSQLESNNPYNTRKFAGLMPGPISNPGRAAIEATLFPAQTESLFFVAKDDGSRGHFFSKTLSQHNSYKNTAAKNRGE